MDCARILSPLAPGVIASRRRRRRTPSPRPRVVVTVSVVTVTRSGGCFFAVVVASHPCVRVRPHTAVVRTVVVVIRRVVRIESQKNNDSDGRAGDDDARQKCNCAVRELQSEHRRRHPDDAPIVDAHLHHLSSITVVGARVLSESRENVSERTTDDGRMTSDERRRGAKKNCSVRNDVILSQERRRHPDDAPIVVTHLYSHSQSTDRWTRTNNNTFHLLCARENSNRRPFGPCCKTYDA